LRSFWLPVLIAIPLPVTHENVVLGKDFSHNKRVGNIILFFALANRQDIRHALVVVLSFSGHFSLVLKPV
jgi:hypothetical protein